MDEQKLIGQIVAKLRQADVELGKGLKVPEACKQLGVSEHAYPTRENMLTWNRSTASYATSCLTGSCSSARPKLATCSMSGRWTTTTTGPIHRWTVRHRRPSPRRSTTLLLRWSRRRRVRALRAGLRPSLRPGTRTNPTRFSRNDWYKKRG